MAKHRFLIVTVVLLALLTSLPGYTQSEPGSERLRVGLVLGGGGARGATHIGVLRELERLRVPVDAVAGTSMGAFIGGLYASGLSAEEVEKVVTSVDWAAVMADRPARSETSFRRKEDDTEYPVDVELGLTAGRVRVPLGLIQGHSLELLLHKLTVHASHIDDFDALPIPFRAVAADLEAAERYVIDHGSLPHAMRASMSVPGILAPTRVHGRLLGDGGLFANLPIDVVREMDVDVVIAVSAEFPLYPPEELDSGLRISEQMVTILIRKDTERQIETLSDADVLIVPDMGTLQSTDFGAVVDTIEPGAAATLVFEERLRQLALDPAAYADHLAARAGAATQRPGALAFVRVRHDGHVPDAALTDRLRTRVGDPADPRLLENDADRLLGLGFYEQVTWHLVDENGRTGVEFEARTKSWGTNELQFGVTLLDDFDGDSEWGISARLNRIGLNSAGAEWRTDLELGSNPYLATELYQPFAALSDWFVAPGAALSRSNVNVNSDRDVIARRRVSKAEAALDVGRRFGNTAELRIGGFRGVGDSTILVGPPEVDAVDFETGGFRASLRADTLNDPHFPTRGLRSNMRWTGSTDALGADVDFDTYQFDVDAYLTRGQSTFSAGLGYGTTSSSASLDPRDLLPLGGFLRLSGLGNETVRGPHTALARLVYRRRIDRPVSSLFDVPTYLGVSLEAGNVWAERSAIDFSSALVNGSVFAGLDTYIGPVYVAAGFGEGGDRAYYLFIGPPPR